MYDDFQQLKHLQLEFLDFHRSLADGVFETGYGNGHRVVVNYNDRAFMLSPGVTVPARGYRL